MESVIPEIFSKTRECRTAYQGLMAFVCGLPGVTIEEKKTCVHAVAGGAAFLGIHPRKSGVRLTLVLDHPIESDRILVTLQASSRRFYCDLILNSPQVDEELRAWIAGAHALRMVS